MGGSDRRQKRVAAAVFSGIVAATALTACGGGGESDSYQRGYEDGRIIVRFGSPDESACALSYVVSDAPDMDEYLKGCQEALAEG